MLRIKVQSREYTITWEEFESHNWMMTGGVEILAIKSTKIGGAIQPRLFLCPKSMNNSQMAKYVAKPEILKTQ